MTEQEISEEQHREQERLALLKYETYRDLTESPHFKQHCALKEFEARMELQSLSPRSASELEIRLALAKWQAVAVEFYEMARFVVAHDQIAKTDKTPSMD